VFHKRDDYAAFLKLLPQAVERLPMRVLAFCLMPFPPRPCRPGYVPFFLAQTLETKTAQSFCKVSWRICYDGSLAA
jgi:hypothetical protein